MAYTLSPAQVAEHLSWLLSNMNHEMEPSDGPFLEVAFDADREDSVVKLKVGTFDADARERAEQRFVLTITTQESFHV